MSPHKGIGRPKVNAPPGIRPEKVPHGIYWHAKRGYWQDSKRRKIADATATLADLAQLAQTLAGIDTSSVEWLCQQFAQSDRYRQLAPKTREDYDYSRRVLCSQPTKAGAFGTLSAKRITRPVMQRLIDRIAQTGPTKAAHVARYFGRVWEWSANRGYVPPTNPVHGIDMPRERKLRRLPDLATVRAVQAFCRSGGGYLWAAAEIAYRCRLRGVEVRALTDASATKDGIVCVRAKGSRTNITAWNASLREAWDWLRDRRDDIRRRLKLPALLRPEQRVLIVGRDGARLTKSGLDSAWQRLMAEAVAAGVISPDERFGLHDLKRRGVTDTEGTRSEKQHASGHRSAGMMDIYDHSLPVVKPAGG